MQNFLLWRYRLDARCYRYGIFDDTLDAFGIHGLVGIWGSLATGIFANPNINGEAGLIYGNPLQLWFQLVAVLVTILFTIVGTFLIFKLSAWIAGGARVEEHVEEQGIDVAYHRERGFAEG